MASFKHFKFERVGDTYTKVNTQIIRVIPKEVVRLEIDTILSNSKKVYRIVRNGDCWLQFLDEKDRDDAFKQVADYLINYEDLPQFNGVE